MGGCSMSSLRRLVGFVMVLALAAFTLPSYAAPDKIFSLAFNPGAVAVGNNPDLKVRIRNESPNGNSSINSIDIVLPTGYTVGGTVAFNPAYSGTIDTSIPGHVKITGMSPVKRGDTVFLNLPVNVGSTASCSASGWDSSVAWTGSSLSGTTFDKTSPTTLGTYFAATTVAGTLGLQFGTLPTSFVIGSAPPAPYSVSVTLTTTCGTPPETNVALTASTSVTGLGTQTTTSGQTSFSLTFNTAGPITVTASATTPPYNTSTSFSSTVFPYGSLACGQMLDSNATNPPANHVGQNDPGYAEGTRGAFNGKGDPCQLVNYNFSNQILQVGGNKIYNIWDTAQKNAAFKYSANWKAEPLVGLYPILKRAKVSWELDSAGVPLPGTLLEGLACLSPKLPAPYGTLGAAVTASASSITITGVAATPVTGAPAVPATPFPVVVKNDVGTGAERMTATLLTNQVPPTVVPGYTGTYTLTYTVSRGTAAEGYPTPPATLPTHLAGLLVMSTPLPIDTRPSGTGPGQSIYSGQSVRMCIVGHGWQMYTPDPVTGSPRFFQFTDAIDNGDGFMGTDDN
jgi:hypothetical protein